MNYDNNRFEKIQLGVLKEGWFHHNRLEPSQLINTQLLSDRLHIRPLEMGDANTLLRYVQENRDWLAPWEPTHPAMYFSLEGQQTILSQSQEERRLDNGILMGIFERKKEPERLRGRISVTGIIRGIWQNGFVGYSIAEDCASKGYMTEALGRVVQYGFGDLGLHRLQASIIPQNGASKRVLEKCGFRYEGRALRYLMIGDEWADHDMYALTTEDIQSNGR